MTREDGDGVIGLSFKAILFGVLFMILLIAGLCQSCGSRKVQAEIAKTEVKAKEESKDTGTQSNQTESSTNSNATENKDITKESTTTKTKEKIDSNGRVTERTTTTKKENKTDRTKKTKSASEALKTFEYKTWVKSYWKTITIHTKEKSKESKTNNNAFYIMIGILCALAIVLGYFYYRERNKVKKVILF